MGAHLLDPPDGRPAPKPRRQAGFTVALLLVALALVAIFMGAAVQLVSFHMRREREAELIFRGEQYVEAIRLYRMRFGRYPMTLREIWEANPRVIRKKWKDPITDSESWGLVFLGQDGTRLGAGRNPRETPTPTPTPGLGFSGPEGQQAVGPIVGVHSTSCDTSIKIYEGRSTYCEWKFVFREQPTRRQRGG